ncbi:unnamed protein product [Medioppia subpectinata]|uniref:Uncharacterized protein n=1 Tax=Medioppia subpectinata TaxID=1979941 RepID=A0A7R9KED8_9ACAR|nr:unnamed protein product [Medioppia subpectinata]CAG2100774.1 unnamed protein product [Medioppia subpectinata]
MAATLVTLILRGTGITNFNFDLTAYAKLELLDLSETPGLRKFEPSNALPATLMNIFMNGCSLDKFSPKTMGYLIKASSVGLAIAQSARYGCYSGTIPGCKCTSGPSAGDYVYKSTLQCTDSVGPAEDFGVSLWRTGGYYFDNFVVEGYPNARLPDRPFVAQTVIKRVIIRDSKQLEAFGSGAEPGVSLFTNLTPGLATLIIANCPSIREQEWPSIAKQLAGQRGVNSTDMDVIGLQHLVVVNSKLDDISLIQDLAPNLETLSLRNTGITSVKHDFRPYSRLRVLDLSDTPGLKRFAITGQLSPTLHNVLLNNCDLRTFNLATLEQLTMVDFVALAGK